MKAKTKFQKFIAELSETFNLEEEEILHIQVQTAAKMYRFLTGDLDAIDITIRKNGKIRIYKSERVIKISDRVKKLLVWAVYRSIENKLFPNLKIN